MPIDAAPLAPGDPVRVVMSKWGERAHWEYDAIYLGSDEHGEWIGCPTATFYSRPGLEFVAAFAGVVCKPAGGAAHLACFNDEHAQAAIYVDMTTPPEWDGTTLRAVDLDLDVVKRQDGTIYLDDEDEFAEHQVAFGYPAEVVAMTERSAAEVLAAVRAGEAPFDGTAATWHEVLQRFGGGSASVASS
ncbi:DUF402 domain-containing protein [Nocardioides humilatus]|uniref:DUF402 domain-containing protein n=1 Tax=Nocardioides humilatus TaxID=2607660 RepID=A0A5B1LHN1_9ACTN|nr:DUF402 domain-containing protein [Nocardioides humilatus]KAA1419127.1 DUF402 domain-containing protein [Nocardioides humilatus]